MKTFREYVEKRDLVEGSRWRQPEELMAMQRRLNKPDNTSRGEALHNAAKKLGKDNLHGLQSKLDNLAWRDADSINQVSFDSSRQPQHIYRGHYGSDPYTSARGVGYHASPWASVASEFGTPLPDKQKTTIGSQFSTDPNQIYYGHMGLSYAKNEPPGGYGKYSPKPIGYSPQPDLDKFSQSHETGIEQDKHGKGKPVLFRGQKIANPPQDEMNKIYRPLGQQLKDIPRHHKRNTQVSQETQPQQPVQPQKPSLFGRFRRLFTRN